MNLIRIVAHARETNTADTTYEKTLQFEDGVWQQEQLRSALEAVLALLDEAKGAASQEGLYTFTFCVERLEGDDVVDNLSEYEFFELVAQHDPLDALASQYCAATRDGAYDDRLWADAETPAATSAILPLVAKDKAAVVDYIDFLRSCDLDHEVDQFGDIARIIDQYGWCDETVPLATARAISCRGQFGDMQFAQFLDDGLREYLAQPQNGETFFEAVVDELHYLSTGVYSHLLHNAAREHYLAEMNEWADGVVELLPARDVERLQAGLSKLWDDAAPRG